jgi:AcrR family transcriptional regulator
MAHPDGRRQRSLRTRAQIVQAATDLFVERGYLGTTIEAVADAAGVAAQTVYYVFGTKRVLLAEVLDASIGGDVEPIAVLDRPWFAALAAETDASSAIEQLVTAAVTIIARTAPIYDVVRGASADPEVGLLLDANRRGRRADQRQLIEIVRDGGHLRADLDLQTAADVFYGLLNEEVFLLLTNDCGWDVERFRTWITPLVAHQLIAPTTR